MPRYWLWLDADSKGKFSNVTMMLHGGDIAAWSLCPGMLQQQEGKMTNSSYHFSFPELQVLGLRSQAVNPTAVIYCRLYQGSAESCCLLDVGQGWRGKTAALGLKCSAVNVSQVGTFSPCRGVLVIFAEVAALKVLLESLLSQSCGGQVFSQCPASWSCGVTLGLDFGIYTVWASQVRRSIWDLGIQWPWQCRSRGCCWNGQPWEAMCAWRRALEACRAAVKVWRLSYDVQCLQFLLLWALQEFCDFSSILLVLWCSKISAASP